MTRAPTTLQATKAEARQTRNERARQGETISHAQALEIIARQYGFQSWNALHASIADRPPENWLPGGRVSGRYLAQPFHATVLHVERRRPGWFRLTLDLDDPVDVVTFESFSNLRKRIHGLIGPDGHTKERTSNGKPHIELDM